MDQHLETTKRKVERMFKPDTLKKFTDADLMLINKNDFEVCMQVYNECVNENKILSRKVRELEARLKKLK